MTYAPDITFDFRPVDRRFPMDNMPDNAGYLFESRRENGRVVDAIFNQPVRAVIGGKVENVGDAPGGRAVWTRSRHPIGNVWCGYAHLSLVSVQTGEWVDKGDILGYAGAAVLFRPEIRPDVLERIRPLKAAFL